MQQLVSTGFFIRIAIRYLFVFYSLFVFSSCGSERSKEEILVGRWNAAWETSGDELSNLSKEDLTMTGYMDFNDQGIVTIQAFGHEGCIFSADTLVHQLQWNLEGDILRFRDHKDDHGLPYAIQKMQPDEIELKLLEDIYLTLRK